MFGLDPEIARALNDMVGSVLDIVGCNGCGNKGNQLQPQRCAAWGCGFMGQTGSSSVGRRLVWGSPSFHKLCDNQD